MIRPTGHRGDLVVTAAGVEADRAASFEQLLRLVPALAGGRLVSADLGFAAAARRISAVLRLADDPGAQRIAGRIAFWFEREGASVLALDELVPWQAEAFRRALASCETLLRDVAPADHAAAARAIGRAAGVAAPPEDLTSPVLALQVGGPGWRGFAYDRATRLLHAPPALTPAGGEAFTLRLAIPELGGWSISLEARVVEDGDGGPGSRSAPSRRGISVGDADGPAHRLLAACCAPPPRDEAPAVRSSAPASALPLGPPRADGLAATGRAALIPPGRPLAPAIPDPSAAAVAVAAPGRRRVLVIDDDALARRMLLDVLESRGFEVLTAADGEAGMRAIIDELLSLDAVVSDVCMPGLSGEELVRTVRCAGREDDLAIVVVTAASDQALRVRLAAWGADVVLSKSAGPESVVHAVETALAARRRAPLLADLPKSTPMQKAGAAGR